MSSSTVIISALVTVPLMLFVIGSFFFGNSFYRSDDEERWETFKTTYGKQYRTADEESLRQEAFRKSVLEVERHNSEAARGGHSYLKETNQFADMFPHELQERLDCSAKEQKPPKAAIDNDFMMKRATSRQMNFVTHIAQAPLIKQTPPDAVDAIDAIPLETVVSMDLALYKSGVFSSSSCGPGVRLNLTMIGFNTDEKTGLDYALIESCWGKQWGEGGNFRLAEGMMEHMRHCGIP